MLGRFTIFSALFTISAAFILPQQPIPEVLANCAPPNGTDKMMHWWQCNAGPVQFLNATPFDPKGNYEYPIHLGEPITMKALIVNPTHTYSAPNLRSTMNIWKYGGFAGCVWTSLPTLGLLKDLDACANGVQCPVKPGKQEMDVTVDFSQYQPIIDLLKDDQPYQMEFLMHDNESGDDGCLMFQAWAYLK